MNGILIIDKPAGWTSHDVVAKLRGVLHEKRIGHAGTLDPMATGVLPVFVGRATRAVQFVENASKTYLAGFLPGIITDTQDTTGTVLERREAEFTVDELKTVLSGFLGPQKQLPPMYSAIKVNGRPLYSMARKGMEIERKPRDIEIFSINYNGREGEEYSFTVSCSKGTYIRSLCADIGDKLGCGGTMSALRRLRAGEYTIERAVTLEQVIDRMERDRMDEILLPIDSVFLNLPAVTASPEQEAYIRVGRAWLFDGAEGRYRVYSQSGEFLMLGEAAEGSMKTVRNFIEVNQ